MSAAISKLVAIASAAGFQSSDGQWSKAFVHWFDCQMPDCVRQTGDADPNVRFFESDATPHNPAGEGFFDDENHVAISFLRAK